MSKKSPARLLSAAVGADPEDEQWYNVTLKGDTTVRTVLVTKDTGTISAVGEDMPCDPDSVTSWTRVHVVDSDWVTRTQENTAKVADAEQRLGLATTLRNTYRETLPQLVAVTPDQRAAFLQWVGEQLDTIVGDRS